MRKVWASDHNSYGYSRYLIMETASVTRQKQPRGDNCTGFSSQGRARFGAFWTLFTAENTQLSPSLTRKPCTLSKCTFKSDLFTIASFIHNATVRDVNLRGGGYSLFSAQSEGPRFDSRCHIPTWSCWLLLYRINSTILGHGPSMQTHANCSHWRLMLIAM